MGGVRAVVDVEASVVRDMGTMSIPMYIATQVSSKYLFNVVDEDFHHFALVLQVCDSGNCFVLGSHQSGSEAHA